MKYQRPRGPLRKWPARPYSESATTQSNRTWSSTATLRTNSAAIRGLVAKTTSSGVWALSRRSFASRVAAHHDSVRNSRWSSRAEPAGGGRVEDLCNFLLLNPSSAAEATNDPTGERCEWRTRRWGFGGLIVTNLHSARPTPPACAELLTRPGRRMTRRSWNARGLQMSLGKNVLSRAACSPSRVVQAQSRSRTDWIPDPLRRGRGSPQRRLIPRNLRGKRRIGAASARGFR